MNPINIFMENEILNQSTVLDNLQMSIQDSSECISQTNSVQPDGTAYYPTANNAVQPDVTAESIILATVILLYGAITMLGAMFAIHRGVSPSYVMRTIALLSVINASVLLVITGVSDAAIAPIVGLFGTIIGYIVNRHPSGNKQD